MGRKTFDSLGKALPNRVNMVVTRNKYFFEDNVVAIDNLQKAIERAREYEKDVYIIGGGEIYKQAIAYADELIITKVHCTLDADTFFPIIDSNIWKKNVLFQHKKDLQNEYDFDIVSYTKIKSA
jgi:dihydrofolate reductase